MRAGGSRIGFIPAVIAATATGVTSALYAATTTTWHDLCATADGKLFVGADEDAVVLSDTADTRLGVRAWMNDEIGQAAMFGRGLISPDGEPDGWVIDGDVLPGQPRFHPATPDVLAGRCCFS